jgi:pyridoxamine 5'-phosphate oxidase family protein
LALDDVYVRYLNGQSRGRLATVDADGAPQVKPVGYHFNPGPGTIDIAGFSMERSAKYRNIAANPNVALVVGDVVGEGAEGTRFLEIRGEAAQVALTAPAQPGPSQHLIRIRPRRLVSWNIDPEHPGLHTADLTGDAPAPEPERLALDLGRAAARHAEEAASRLVCELQEGWDAHDAELSNQHFADDIVWGSPFGATVYSYAELHAIHVRLKRLGRGGPASRYETVKVLAPAPAWRSPRSGGWRWRPTDCRSSPPAT